MSVDRLVLAPGVEASLREAAARAYPEECCGALVGRGGDGARHVLRAVTLDNVHDGARERRYLVDPGGLLRVVRETERNGLAVLGFFHSHPDGTAEPSAHDAALAWPWYSYLIVPVRGGRAGAPRAWTLVDGRAAGFEEQTVWSAERGHTERPASSGPTDGEERA